MRYYLINNKTCILTDDYGFFINSSHALYICETKIKKAAFLEGKCCMNNTNN
jgi:hypothetical protein